MSVLSITFHSTEKSLEKWENYTKNELQLLIDNLMQVNQYLLCEVETDWIQEGKNYNLLLFFDTNELREEFVINELTNISERIEKEFGEDILMMKTLLNPKSKRF